ncbi:putative O-glycosylation ligase, exosortase A system-associated [Thioalkalivibrio sp. ALJT]|uniref:putative O-glycosylation ligase, exosortase A system-associated n=1 Tax=Thioalkalivibrio sp. ALJT TaxID=1158146 RepID=UPI000373C581|nr:putative O-glycosylation ligase, exosortase A system-associated [Thioalkalivibrio sp. ALJT]
MRDILFALLIFGSLPFILWRPWVGIAMWYWVGLMNPHRLTWGFLQTMPVAMAVGLATLAALVLNKDRRTLPLTRESVLMVILFGHITIISLFFAWQPEVALQRWDTVMKIMLFTLIAPMLVFGKVRTMAVLAVITLSIAFFGFKGGPYTLASGFGGMVLGPPGSFIRGNTDIGLALVMTLPLVLVLARQVYQGRFELPFYFPLYERHHKLIGLGLYLGFWFHLISIIGTHSRGAWVALAITFPLIFLKMRYKGTMIATGLLAIAVIGFTVPDKIEHQIDTLIHYEEDASAIGRLDAWNVSWNVAMDYPLTGSGMSIQRLPPEIWLSYLDRDNPVVSGPIAAHSIYFQMLGEHGFVGLALFLMLIGFTLLTLFRLSREGRRREETLWIAEWAWALAIGLIGYMIAGAFLSLAYFDLYLAFIAMAIVLRRELLESMPTTTPVRQSPVRYAPAAQTAEQKPEPPPAPPGTPPATGGTIMDPGRLR